MYYTVTIENLNNNKKYDVIVETQVEVNERFETLANRVIILKAIEQIANKLTKGGKKQFIKAAEHIYEKSNDYDNFTKKLKTNLKIKVKIKKI